MAVTNRFPPSGAVPNRPDDDLALVVAPLKVAQVRPSEVSRLAQQGDGGLRGRLAHSSSTCFAAADMPVRFPGCGLNEILPVGRFVCLDPFYHRLFG